MREMVSLVRSDDHEGVNDTQLQRLETDIAFLLLQLGLATADAKQESFSWTRSRESLNVNLKKAGEGLAFYSRGTQLLLERRVRLHELHNGAGGLAILALLGGALRVLDA